MVVLVRRNRRTRTPTLATGSKKGKGSGDNDIVGHRLSKRDKKDSNSMTFSELISDVCLDCGYKNHSLDDSSCRYSSYARGKPESPRLQPEVKPTRMHPSYDDDATKPVEYFRPGSKPAKVKRA